MLNPLSPERTRTEESILSDLAGDEKLKGDEKLDLASTKRVKQHTAWDVEFETLGKREAEHVSAQWKLIRQELGSFADDLASLHLGLEESKRNAQLGLTKLGTKLAEQDRRIQEERDLRITLEDHVKRELEKLHTELQSEARQREAGDWRIDSELSAKQEAHEQVVHERCKDLPTLKEKLGNLHVAITRFPPQLEALRENINQETRAREAGHDLAMRHLKDHKEAVPRLIYDATRDLKPHKQELADVRDTMERETTERQATLQLLHDKVHSAHSDIAQHKEDLSTLQRICQELEGSIIPRLGAQQHDIEVLRSTERSERTKLEQSLQDLSLKLDGEAMARSALVAEVEQTLLPLKSKLRSIGAEHSDALRQAREELETSLREKVQKEADAREALHKSVQGQVLAHKAVLEARLEAMHRGHKDLEHKLREAPAGREVDPAHARKTEQLARQVRQLESRLPEEKPTRGTVHYPHEDQIAYLEQFLKETCERFIDGLQRRKNTLPPRSVVVEYAELPSEEKALSGDAVKEGPSITGPELGVHKPMQVVAMGTGRGIPNLNTEKESQLKQVLAGNRIELVVNPAAAAGEDLKAEANAFEARLHLKEPIDFVPVHHGDTSEAQFTNEDKAREILCDVAEVLKVYHCASLNIEGHTATPLDRMDKWAHELAHRRAEKVKATIVGFGIDGRRLGTVGLPGHLGSGKHDTVLKITSF